MTARVSFLELARKGAHGRIGFVDLQDAAPAAHGRISWLDLEASTVAPEQAHGRVSFIDLSVEQSDHGRVSWVSLERAEVKYEPPVVRVPPDAYPGGVPTTGFLRESANRNGFIHFATGHAEQPTGVVYGAARAKSASLVATGASGVHGVGEVAATAEFRDVELEMVAMLLAA